MKIPFLLILLLPICHGFSPHSLWTKSCMTGRSLYQAAESGEVEEATTTPRVHQFCNMPKVPERVLGDDVTPVRARLIRIIDKKWFSGDILHYYFFDKDTDGETVVNRDGTTGFRSYVGAEDQIAVVQEAFDVYRNLNIGLEFKQVFDREDAEIRIGFMQGDGAWSYLGRDIVELGLSVQERTMNFGWDLTRPGEIDTAIHEIGHTMGFPHEHQNPNAGIMWDEEAVYAELGGPPNNWPRATTYWNIIKKLNPSEVEGSDWDPDSVMHYPFGPGLILQPVEYKRGIYPAGGLSPKDIAMIRQFYPALDDSDEDIVYTDLKPFQSQNLDIAAGEQKNFLIKPPRTRRFRMQTFGSIDSVMVLYEEQDGEFREIQYDNDSGMRKNARIVERLVKGRTYALKVRMVFSGEEDGGAIFLW